MCIAGLCYVPDERDPPRVATLFFDETDRAERADCCSARVGRAHARGNVLVDLLLQVQLDLALQ